jgi:hypothetical protein
MDISKNISKTYRESRQEKSYPMYQKSINMGLIAGIGMGLFLMLINSNIEGIHTSWSLAKYAILGLVLGYGLYQYKQASPEGKTFKYGITHGVLISIIAAMTLVGVNTLINSVGIDGLITERYNLQATNLANLIILDVVLLFECAVFGMILTFIWLQLFKESKPAE